MKTKQNKTLAVIIVLAATLAMSSCQKEKVTPTVKNSDNIKKAEESFNDIQRTIMFEVTRNLFYKTETCEVITDDTVSVPHIKTIDYGTGCTDSNGKVRSGQMIITYDTDNFMNVTDANSYTTFNNFFINGEQITGSFNIHNNGLNGNGNYNYTVIGKYDLIHDDGTDALIGEQYIEWVAGAATSDKSDDEYSYTGTINATGYNGDERVVTILEPLIEKNICATEHFVSGEELYQMTSMPDRTLDYGDGICDDLGVETVNGVSQTVTLQ